MALTFKKIAKLSTSELVTYYNAAMTKQIDVADDYARNRKRNGDFAFRLNPSSLPCCPILNTFAAVGLLRASETTMTTANGMLTTYGEMGSIRHAVCQQFLGRAGRIYGDWYCPSCRTTVKQSLFKLCKCGEIPFYQEMRFEHTYKGRVVKSFKPDGIFKDSKGRLWVIDYKFKTRPKFYPSQIKSLPLKENRTQVLDYVHTLRMLGGKFKNVRGYILLYIAFDKVILEGGYDYHPVQRSVSRAATAKYRKTLDREYRRLFVTRRAAKAVIDKDVDREIVIELVKNKPCANHEQYMKVMHNKYSPCPYAESGECFKSRFVKTLHTDLRELSCV